MSDKDELPEGWAWSTVGEVGRVDLGRQRHPDWHTGPEMMPYLRVANVFEDRIDTSDVMQMDFSGVFDKYRLYPGDVLLNEGQSPYLVGRPALYRGQPSDVAFTNSLIRFRAFTGILPEWALLVFRGHLHAGRFMREARITTNIAHLSAERLKAVEFPVPPTAEQQRIVDQLSEHFERVDKICLRLTSAIVRLDQLGVSGSGAVQPGAVRPLRRALIAEAAAGRLIAQDPADEPAVVLLERVHAERETLIEERLADRKANRARSTATRSADSGQIALELEPIE